MISDQILPSLSTRTHINKSHFFKFIIPCYYIQADQSRKEGKDQESIQSSTTPDPGYQWESDNLKFDITNRSQEVSPFPAGDQKALINRHARKQNKNKTEIT